MVKLKNIVQQFDEETQKKIRKTMDLIFVHYNGESNWEEIYVYTEYEEIITKIFAKGYLWYFAIAAEGAANCEFQTRSIRLTVVQNERETKIYVRARLGKRKKGPIKEYEKADKEVVIFLSEEEEELIKR